MRSVCLILVLLFSAQLMFSSESNLEGTSIIIEPSKLERKFIQVDSDFTEYGEKAMLQGFYWLTPDNAAWWPMLTSKIQEIKESGFDSIWAPPFVKTGSGNIARGGYEPYDYYDLGEFDQGDGVVPTRFGYKEDLINFVATANSLDLAVVADIIINHNTLGNPEFNSFTNTQTLTNFENIASGIFPRNFTHFHPCEYADKDDFAFGNLPDLCHEHPYVRQHILDWANWLKNNVGFDGWRFDVALGIPPNTLMEWMNDVGGSPLSIAEHWNSTGTLEGLTGYLDETNNTLAAFDFFLMHELRKMVIQNGEYDLTKLSSSGLLWNGRVDQAITFVTNHDTVRQTEVNIPFDRQLAYSYILTHEGYPSVFHKDYFNPDLQLYLKALLYARSFATGETEILHESEDLYVMQRNGSPGLIYALNDNFDIQEITISTKYLSTTLYDQITGKFNGTTDATGQLVIMIPPRSFLVLTNQLPYYYVNQLKDRDNFIPATKIDQANIQIDGKLDLFWDYPTLIDIVGDGPQNQRDLQNSYFAQNETHIFGAITHGTDIFGAQLDYRLGIDNQPGGSIVDVSHPQIRFSGNSQLDYIINFSTDSKDPWNTVNTVNLYKFEEDWEEETNDIQFQHDPILGYLEFNVAKSNINLQKGGNIRFKWYTTSTGNPNAEDSLPQDNSIISSDGNSWLFPTESYTIEAIPQTETISPMNSTNSKSIFLLHPLLIYTITWLTWCRLYGKHSMKKVD